MPVAAEPWRASVNMLWENTIFMTVAYNNAKMQWPYSRGENMLKTFWYDPLCLYIVAAEEVGAQSLQDTAQLSQIPCWLFTHPHTHTHISSCNTTRLIYSTDMYTHSCDGVGSDMACTNPHFSVGFFFFYPPFFCMFLLKTYTFSFTASTSLFQRHICHVWDTNRKSLFTRQCLNIAIIPPYKRLIESKEFCLSKHWNWADSRW